MVGFILRARKNIDRGLALDFLNSRQRTLMDRRGNWSGLLGTGVIAIPNAYTTGTITLTQNSTSVTGSGTSWPTNDIVNTTISQAVQPGWQWVTPASLAGINRMSVLYVDAGGANPEVCPVSDILGTNIYVYYQYAHAASHTATQSSLANLQLQLGSTVPIFTVQAVTSPTTLIMDAPWGIATQSGTGYNIILIYTPIATDLKDLLFVVDPFQGIPMRIHVSQEELNLIDPNRTATNNPTTIADRGPSASGVMLYEIYPPQYSVYQLNFMYHKQWPDMRLPGDRPAPFINPSILMYGALADAYRTPVPIGPEMKDPWLSPQTAEVYEKRFELGYADAINADNNLYQSAFTWQYQSLYGIGNAAFWQSHDASSMQQDF